MSKYVAFVPVRCGSKSIPLKNIKEIAGKPLVYWVVDSANNSELIDKVYVSTDCEEIKRVVNRFNLDKVVVIDRSAETATDTASTELAMLEFADKYEFENIVLLQATSPLTSYNDIDNAIRIYETGGYDSLLSVVRQKRFIWKEKDEEIIPVNYDFNRRPRRQEFEGFLVENGAIYITNRTNLLKTGNRLNGRIGFYEMPEYTYYEVDEEYDWHIVEMLLRKYRCNFNKRIKLFLSDVDGVLTDGGMYYSAEGEILKKFNAKDGMGFGLLKKQGIKTGIITKERSEIVKRRCEKLNLDYCYIGIEDKREILDEIIEKERIGYDEIAYIGDDINDVEVLKIVGISFAPKDAVFEIRSIVDVIVNKNGGEGAVREAIEYILKYAE